MSDSGISLDTLVVTIAILITGFGISMSLSDINTTLKQIHGVEEVQGGE